MNRHVVLTTLALLLFAVVCTDTALAQKVIPAQNPRPSPLAVASKKLPDGTYVKITYSQPQRRDPKTSETRKIFGGLVPYGKVWRLGANEATEITTTGDIELGGKRLPAGTYALMAIPGENEWTIIVNKDLGMWGDYTYKDANDFVRFTVPAKKSADTYEAFTMAFDEPGTTLNVNWENMHLAIPVKAL